MTLRLILTLGCLWMSIAAATGQSMGLALEGTEWAGTAAYAVKGRNGFLKEKLSFGEYRTVGVDRSWTRGYTVTTGWTSGIPTDEFYRKIITTDHIHRKQTLYFSLSDAAGHQSQAYCLTQLEARDFNIGNRPVSVINLLLDLAGPGMASTHISFARLYDGASGEGWDLLIDHEAVQRHPGQYIGYLARSETEYYTITPATRIQSKKGKVGTMPFGSAGFEIRNPAGRPVAAVSLMGPGIIYLTDMAPRERLLLATACSALLMRPTDL